jgi:Zn-finger nucleic acid-binding protein
MKCPVCETHELVVEYLEAGLPAESCPGCGGNWISSVKYWSWLQSADKEQAEAGPGKSPIQVSDNDCAKLCPQCGHILMKYEVGHGEPFRLDQCATCNGIWFDKNEWDALKQDNLHDKVNLVFTAPWQKQVQREHTREHLDTIYTERFGAADYAELKRIRAWVYSRAKRESVLAFLNDVDPYSA